MEKRTISLFVFFCVCFTGLMLRIGSINFSEYSLAGSSRSQRTVTIGTSRGKIYDRNLKKLVDEKSNLIAAVTPAIGSGEYLDFMSDMDSFDDKIQNGFPFTVQVENEISNDFIRTFSVPVRYSENQSAVHLIGYLGSDGKSGVTGIEKAYNGFLKENSGSLSVSFDVDAKGRVLAGMDKYINDNNFNSQAGLVLTIDKEIQKLCEEALAESRIESGCSVVMQADTGEILAMTSVPVFDPYNVQLSLFEENSPLINKALQQYSVGSVFKPLICAVALENGITPDYEFECSGSYTLGDEVFCCYNSTAHGVVNMQTALEKSCNCYFIELMMKIDADYLLKLCADIGIGEADSIADGIRTSPGALPERESLEVKGNLANLAFGQGSLLMTPVQMAKMYHVLATGNVVAPTVIYGVADASGLVTRKNASVPQKLLTDGTVLKLRQMLQSVTDNGNAYNAKSDAVSLSGKTGTAQSGMFIDGNEICRTWFAGFFPSQNPGYIVIVLNEQGESGNSDCAPVFKRICEGIVK